MDLREVFPNTREYNRFLLSPETYNKSNAARFYISRLNELLPTTKSSGLSDAEIFENQVVKNILMPEPGDQMHHKNALSLVGTMLANTDDAGKEAIFNLLEANSVPYGDHIANYLKIDGKSHTALHQFAREKGLEIQGKGGKGSKGLAKRVNESKDIIGTLKLLQEYIDIGIPLLTDKQDSLIQEADRRKAGQVINGLVQRVEETGAKSIDSVNQDDKNVTINAENVYMEKAVNGNGINGRRPRSLKGP